MHVQFMCIHHTVMHVCTYIACCNPAACGWWWLYIMVLMQAVEQASHTCYLPPGQLSLLGGYNIDLVGIYVINV